MDDTNKNDDALDGILIPYIDSSPPILHVPIPPPFFQISYEDDDVVGETTKNSINIIITKKITLIDFVIKEIRIVPSRSATVTIIIHTSYEPCERIVFLEGTDYTNWSSDDDYLYNFIQQNIKTIY